MPGMKKQNYKQRGANLAEYMLLCILILVVCVAAIRGVGLKTSKMWSTIDSAY
jgi:Flp pilus assembly pilin Flp